MIARNIIFDESINNQSLKNGNFFSEKEVKKKIISTNQSINQSIILDVYLHDQLNIEEIKFLFKDDTDTSFFGKYKIGRRKPSKCPLTIKFQSMYNSRSV